MDFFYFLSDSCTCDVLQAVIYVYGFLSKRIELNFEKVNVVETINFLFGLIIYLRNNYGLLF